MSIEVLNESGFAVEEFELAQCARYVLDEMRVHPRAELCIKLVDEPAMSDLHEQWMGEPGATDVLSFPMDELRPGRLDAKTPAGILGDIVICPQVADRQADAAGHDLAQEIIILTTHGMLHLLGFDHATPPEEAEMFGIQRDIVTAFHARERSL